MSRIRCFVAADLPDAVRAELAALQKRLRARRADLRWVAPTSMHLTLKFLGEIQPEVFEAASRLLDAPLGIPGPLRLRLQGVGAFPSPRRARVLWVGLGGHLAGLARAALTVEARAEAAGIPRESRPFSPHLTLGRSRGPSGVPGLEDVLREEADFVGPEFEVAELVLYESRLRPEGPLYVPTRKIAL